MTPRHLTVVPAAAAVLALAACGSSASSDTTAPGSAAPSSSAVASTSAPAPSTTAPPAVWTQAEAQQQYTAMANTVNAAIPPYNKLFDTGSQDVAEWNAACSGLANAEDAFQRSLAAGRWPTTAQAAVTDLIAALSVERASVAACATATTMSAVQAATDSVVFASTQAQTVRVILGLPGTQPVPTSS